MRGDQHRDRHCARHVDLALIETTSGTQLVCPLLDCSYYERTDVQLKARVRKR